MFRGRTILNDHAGMESFPVGYVRKSRGLLRRINRSILPDCELCLPLCNTDKLESLLLIMVDIWPQSFSLQAISGMKSGFPVRIVCNSAHQEDLGSLYITQKIATILPAFYYLVKFMSLPACLTLKIFQILPCPLCILKSKHY